MSVETDVADVAAAPGDFVIIDADTIPALPEGQLVTYCWGPACNGAGRAGLKLAEHGRSAKEMLGFEYWERDGLPVARG